MRLALALGAGLALLALGAVYHEPSVMVFGVGVLGLPVALRTDPPDDDDRIPRRDWREL